MRLCTLTDVVEHRGRTLVVRAVRGPGRHAVSVQSGGVRREFVMGGRFGAELRNRAVEKYIGLEVR
jgi:hypothetical protein